MASTDLLVVVERLQAQFDDEATSVTMAGDNDRRVFCTLIS